ncbi:MAG: M23 family metallopeptidase, partial [Robiginitomaculum sp.]|nr:M23 family metallopeptidase [Robiginitomaculum sp.]
GYERMGEGIRHLFGFVFLFFLAACGQVESSAQITHIDTPFVEIVKTSDLHLNCQGVFEQGGMVICKTLPFANIHVGDMKAKADGHGLVVFGFDRDSDTAVTIKSSSGDITAEQTFKITPRKYTISRIDGLPPSQVSNYSKAQLVRIRSSSARKKIGFASREQTMWFRDGFTYPLKSFVKTSPFGAQRILNGIKKKPHYGVDIAAPVGTPIYAPADGVVSLADDDLYFEGAMVLLDHGQGLISMYLHMSAIDVTPGQMVKRGEKLGEVGSKGRSTGPHLCWRLKWRNRHLDPELLTEWPSHEDAND